MQPFLKISLIITLWIGGAAQASKPAKTCTMTMEALKNRVEFRITTQDYKYLTEKVKLQLQDMLYIKDKTTPGKFFDRVLSDGSLIIRSPDGINLVRPSLVNLKDILLPIPTESKPLWEQSGIAGTETIIEGKAGVVIFREGDKTNFKTVNWNANTGDIVLGQFESPGFKFLLNRDLDRKINISVQKMGLDKPSITSVVIPADAILENYDLAANTVTLTIRHSNGSSEIKQLSAL